MGTKILNISKFDSPMSIVMGDIKEASVMHKFGMNPDIDTGSVPEDIWDFGGVYTFSTTADIDTISSSNAGDTQEVTIYGLDENWETCVQTVTLTGRTKVTLTTSLIRVFRMVNIGTTDIAGIVYCYVDGDITDGAPDTPGDVRAIISDGHNQTLMAIYTIPAGKTGYLVDAYSVISHIRSSEAALMRLRVRPFGSVFQTKNTSALNSNGTSYVSRKPKIPSKLLEKTDIKIQCTSVTAINTAISAGFEIILVDNE